MPTSARILTLFVLLTIALGAQAISIRADSSAVNLQTGHREHSGNVVVVDGNFQLKADKLIEYRESGVLTRVEAYGEPSRFKQEPVTKGGLAHGQARRIDYVAGARQVKLSNYAVTDTNGNTMKGKRVTYILK